jgi:hypothetical protein
MTTFGNTTLEANDSSIKDSIQGFIATCPGSYIATSIVAAIKNTTVVDKFAKCALYDMLDNLVAQTTEITIPSDPVYHWFTFPFAAPPALLAQDYLITVWGDDVIPIYIAFKHDPLSSTKVRHQVYGALFPNPIAWTITQAWELSIYCNLIPRLSSGGIPHKMIAAGLI